MDKYAEFLRARLDEDEAEIRKHPDQGPFEPDGYLATAEQNYPCDSFLQIGKSRALADVAAKRKILDAAEEAIRANESGTQERADPFIKAVFQVRADWALLTVQALCEPFASHHQYPGERPV